MVKNKYIVRRTRGGFSSLAVISPRFVRRRFHSTRRSYITIYYIFALFKFQGRQNVRDIIIRSPETGNQMNRYRFLQPYTPI